MDTIHCIENFWKDKLLPGRALKQRMICYELIEDKQKACVFFLESAFYKKKRPAMVGRENAAANKKWL